MALTLAEYMRSQQVMDPRLAGVIKVFTKNAPILGDGQNIGAPIPALRWENTVGGIVSWVREVSLPTAAFRALNTDFDATEGATEKITEDLKLIGARIEADRAIAPRGNGAGLVTQKLMQVAAVARKFNQTFFKGDGTSNSFTGLQTRLATSGENLIDNGGEALDLYLLDKILLNMRGEDRALYMGSGMAARIQQAAKTQPNVNYTPEIFGQGPARYNGVPIVLAGEDASEAEILGFTEEGTTDKTSIYVLSLDATRGVVGAQTRPLQVLDYDKNKVDESYLIEWDCNFIIKTKRAAYRLKNIADAAIGEDAETVS